MNDSHLFAVKMSRGGGLTHFSLTTGHVSIARFPGWEFEARNGKVRNRAEVELEELANAETLTLQRNDVLSAFSHEPSYAGVYA